MPADGIADVCMSMVDMPGFGLHLWVCQCGCQCGKRADRVLRRNESGDDVRSIAAMCATVELWPDGHLYPKRVRTELLRLGVSTCTGLCRHVPDQMKTNAVRHCQNETVGYVSGVYYTPYILPIEN